VNSAPANALLRNSAPVLVLLLPFMVAGFWPSYFAKLGEGSVRMHLHGLAMLAWCLLLVGQAWLMRVGNRPLHRSLGRISYVLIPAILASTITMAHFRLNASPAVTPPDILYFIYVQLFLLAFFVLAYALAMINRQRPLVHARFMICTALPLIDPIGARLLYNTLKVDFPLGQMLTYGFSDAILVALAIWEWRRGTGSKVFLGMLVVLVALQVPTFFLYKLPVWQQFATWFAGLPLP